MSIRTRLAPSPTGFMHIGTLRTALWDYFLAKQQGGQYVLRIEDTDQKRLVEGALESLLRTFQRVNIQHDEGPMLQPDGELKEVGDYGPYVQSARLDIYKKYADQLVAGEHAYVCFCTPERLDEMRAAQAAAKQTTKYDRKCLRLSKEDIATRLKAGEAHVIRLRIPDGQSTFCDAIRGQITFQNSDIDDQVLVKSDGFASYHLAVVIDDELMKISHVLRGEEWIASTPKQIILCQALGFTMPTYAHVPLLLNADRSKLSKRQGDVAVEDYLAKGYLPAALLNFIATLGFNPTADREIYTLDELTQMFDLSKVNKSGAVVNFEKLNWMNHQYLMQLSAEELVSAVQPFLSVVAEPELLKRALLVERQRVDRLDGFNEKIQPYVQALPYEAAILTWKKATPADAKDMLTRIHELIAALPAASFAQPELLETPVKEYIVSEGLQNGNVLWPLRVALSGAEKSASPFECLWVLGQAASVARIETAIAKLTSV